MPISQTVQELEMVRMGFRSTALLLSAARNYPGPVCVLGNLSCPHWQCRRGRSTHRKTIPRIGRRAV